jgi:hypothetical protein
MRRIFAIVAIAIVALMMMVLLPLLMRRCPCCCQTGIINLVTMAFLPLICNGVVFLFAMVLSLSSSWHCCPCYNGVFIINDAQASLPSSQWHCCPHHDGVVAIDAQVSLLLSQWQCCPCCNGISAIIIA